MARILVVEDEPENRLLIGMVLRTEGFEVVEAEDGPTGLRMAGETAPDLILLDVMMPGMNGWAVRERLQADTQTAQVPIIMLTALAQRADVERAVSLGVDGYITKPFEPYELVEAIGKLLSSKQSAKEK